MSENVTKTELIRMACKKSQMSLPFNQMQDALESILDAVMENIENGSTVTLQGLGRFIPEVRPAGEGRNPSTGETIQYPARLGVKFAVNTNFKLALREVDIKSLGAGADSKSGNAKAKAPEAKPGKASKDTKAAPARRGRR